MGFAVRSHYCVQVEIISQIVGHSYCRDCIQDVIDTAESRGKPAKCPSCKYEDQLFSFLRAYVQPNHFRYCHESGRRDLEEIC